MNALNDYYKINTLLSASYAMHSYRKPVRAKLYTPSAKLCRNLYSSFTDEAWGMLDQPN